MICKIISRGKKACKGINVISNICERHRKLGLDKFSDEELNKFTYCTDCEEIIVFNRECIKCKKKQCKALDRKSNFCRSTVDNNHLFCEKHIKVGLNKLTEEELYNLEICKMCQNRYKLNNKCLDCHNYILCKANNQKGMPCHFKVIENHKFCKDHLERYGHYSDEEFSKLIQCAGSCKMYFLPTDTKKTCPKCLENGFQNRLKNKEKQIPCIWQMGNKMCEFKASENGSYCEKHLPLYYIKLEEEKLGMIYCKSKYSCKNMIPKNELSTCCEDCKERLRQYDRLNRKFQPYRQTVQYKLAVNSRTRLKDSLKSQNVFKKLGTSILVGCSYKELMEYLEKLFLPKMSWDLLGNNKIRKKCDICSGIRTGIHIDHIIPLSSFNLSDENEQIKAYHYTNLRPMWNCCNLKKSDSIIALIEEES